MNEARHAPAHSQHKHRLRALAFAVALVAITMAGCVRYQQTIVVRPDGSGTVEYLIAFSEDLLGGATDEQDPDMAALHPRATAERYQQDGFAGYTIRIPFSSLSELGDIAGVVGDSIVVERNDAEWQFAMTFSEDATASEASILEDSLTQSELEALQAALAEGFASTGASWTVRLALPGDPIEHNATRYEDGLLIWALDLGTSAAAHLTARSVAQAGLAPQPPASGSSGGAAAASRQSGTPTLAILVFTLLLAATWVARRLAESGTRASGG